LQNENYAFPVLLLKANSDSSPDGV